MTRSLLIIWHSRTGTARQLAAAAAQGAEESADRTDVAVDLIPAEQVTAQQLIAADAYIFACPENLASMSGVMKDMVDRHYYALIDRANGRACALMIAAGTDGSATVQQWRRIITGWRLKLMAEPMIVRTGADTAETIWTDKRVTDEALTEARELGSAMAAGLAMGVY